MKKLIGLAFLALLYFAPAAHLRAQAPTVVFSDTFTSTADLQNTWCWQVYPTCLLGGGAASAVPCPSGWGFTYTTCASLPIPAGLSGEQLLDLCTPGSSTGNLCGSGTPISFNLHGYSSWYAYWEIGVSANATLNYTGGPETKAKFTYLKDNIDGSTPVGVCYYDVYVPAGTSLSGVQVGSVCDEYGQDGTFGAVNLTTQAMHTLEISYASGGYMNVRFDGVAMGNYPVGMMLGSQNMSDISIGVYLNAAMGSQNSWTMYLSNFKVCTGNWCSASPPPTPPVPRLTTGGVF